MQIYPRKDGVWRNVPPKTRSHWEIGFGVIKNDIISAVLQRHRLFSTFFKNKLAPIKTSPGICCSNVQIVAVIWRTRLYCHCKQYFINPPLGPRAILNSKSMFLCLDDFYTLNYSWLHLFAAFARSTGFPLWLKTIKTKQMLLKMTN